MSGNVWEWCADYFAETNYYQQRYKKGTVINPQGPELGSFRVNRGGAWFLGAQECRTSSRNEYAPAYFSHALGFRIVLSALPVHW